MRKLLLGAALLLSFPAAAAGSAAPSQETAYSVNFKYEGRSFDPSVWKCDTLSTPDSKVFRYTSPDARLLLELTCRQYPDYPVTEIRPVLKVLSDEPTAIIEDFNSLRLVLPFKGTGIKVRRITGSMTSHTDFCRQDVLLQRRPGCDRCSMNSHEGRSSTWLPYFGIDLEPTHGYEFAVGWSGTWHADFSLGRDFILETGIGEKTHFRMEPGEVFKMPYVVMYERKGKSAEDGLVEFHRFIISNKSPRDSKGRHFEPLLPLTAGGGNKTDANMLRILEKSTATFKVPFNTFWVDAGWYGEPHEAPQESNCGPYWFQWAGLWKPNTVIHPDGNLRRISDAAHAKGMKFLLWFEPERATASAPIVREHPEYFHRDPANPQDNRFLLDLGCPEAREWVVGEVSRNITESGVDIYRQDFNIDPLPVWRGMDAPDRQGAAEIRHINGLYEFWDELHRRFPDMLFESCAGGGRRLDVELMSKAHSYCRDDAHMSNDPEELCQNITLNTTPYIPFTGGETFKVKPFDSYAFLSCMAAGTVFTPTDFNGMLLSRDPSAAEVEWFTGMLQVADRVRPLFSGDFYALNGDRLDGHDVWCGYQLVRPAEGDGFFIVFRRAECPDDTFFLQLRGIDPGARYLVEEFGSKPRTMRGRELASRLLSFPEPRSFRLVFFSKK